MLHIEKANSSYLKISGDTNDKMLVSSHFRKPVKDYFFMPKYKAGIWDGHIKFYNASTGFLPYGLFDIRTIGKAKFWERTSFPKMNFSVLNSNFLSLK